MKSEDAAARAHANRIKVKKGASFNEWNEKQHEDAVALPRRDVRMHRRHIAAHITSDRHPLILRVQTASSRSTAQTSVRHSLPVIYYWGARPDLNTALTLTPQPWRRMIYLGSVSRHLHLFDPKLHSFESGKFSVQGNLNALCPDSYKIVEKKCWDGAVHTLYLKSAFMW